MSQLSNKYNLEERTAQFGESVIILCRAIRQDNVSSPNASSRKDFSNKIFICKKEAQETRHWLRMLKTATPTLDDSYETIIGECQELTLIFQKITSSLRRNTGTMKIDQLKT